MDIVNQFKNHLFSQKKPAGTLTIKNYLADVKKFIAWYEQKYAVAFTPEAFTSDLIAQYQATILKSSNKSLPAISSMKRYLSSLRKFASFMEEAKLIFLNPFKAVEKKQSFSDPFYLKAFISYLYTQHASKLTIKNYTNDSKQFLRWLEQVTASHDQAQPSSLLSKIDNRVLEEYKMRLFKEAKLSPVSINRKLSSLRRYVRWLEEKDIITITTKASPEPEAQPKPHIDRLQPFTRELPLTALQGLAEEKQNQTKAHYSSFAPIRLAQKSTKVINLALDLLIFNPIAHTAESLHYLLWKSGKKVIFAPVITILENASYVPKGVTIKTIVPKQVSMIPPRTANPSSVIKKVVQYGIGANPVTVRNFTKALYAPLEISTEQMHWMQRLWHNLRYNRPDWYSKYHSYSLVSYIHFAVMMIVAVIAGSALYQTWTSRNLNPAQAVLAAQDTVFPRTLTFQGRLLNNTNTPITTQTPLRFALYNNPTATGAAQLWNERQDIKPDHNGYFTATLGKVSRLDQKLFSNSASLYVGISINGNPELTPREEIPTSNYAANSKTVEGLKPITDSPDLAQNVLLALDSSGNLTIGGNAGHTFQATGGQLSLSGQALLLTTSPGSNGNVQIVPDGSGIIDLQRPIQNTSNYTTTSGIPGAVEVADILSVLATSSSQSALVVNQNGTGDIISGLRNGIDKFRLDNGGNAFFGGKIILNGDTIDSTSTAFDIGGGTVTHLTVGSNASVISLGGSAGVTSIRNSLAVLGTTSLSGAVNTSGLLTANAGLTIPNEQKLTLANFTPGAIPFIDANSQVIQDASRFNWNDVNKTLNVFGSLCVNSVAGGTCDATPGTITSKTLNTVGTADLAEDYVSSENLEPGDVVAAEGANNTMAVIKSTAPYQKQLLGIVSTNPGITLNSDAQTDYEHPHVYPLALEGRVPVKVSSINGQIQPGDDLTSSSIPGVAMVASASGQIIGKALESYENPDPNQIGKIMAFVTLSYHTSPASISQNGDINFATKPQGEQNPAPQLTREIQASDSASQTPLSTASAALELGNDIATPSAPLYNSIASSSATASSSAKTKAVPTPTPTNVLETNAALPENFAPLTNSGSKLTYVPNFKADYATVTGGIIALGPTSLTDAAVSDMIIVNNNLKITSDSLDTIGTDLNIQPLRQGNILFQGGLIAMDTQGNLKVNGDATFSHDVRVNGQFATGIIAPIPNHDLAINLKNKTTTAGSNLTINNANGNEVVKINQAGDVIASGEATFNTIASQGFTIIRGAQADASSTQTVADGSGGKGSIAAHQTERTIFTPYVTSHSLIYVTATSNSGNVSPYVARQTAQDQKNGTKGSFSVEIPYAADRDISFNWWIVN